MFATEFEGGKWRGFLTNEAAKKENAGNVRKVILDTLEYYKKLNPEALQTINGVKVCKPAWQIAHEEKQRLEYSMKKLEIECEESKANQETTTTDQNEDSK